ncbi:50S ribosomal protein L19, putative [Perkinsus marinus ATCC 50983]|uniref:50S ribosomal protein L19, chloroplastic n=1 Tax=Perkinsus marinus (strain ATCC 50983 / TXsc) TaxID=423536 RepID=C5L4M8_PERM5|nr:50S ribosomal protein L19, putative [Perkinsus marinus ATCC 50983]EER08296.1 50S ribosomal protein L19, putative [Perkinsus marinus ATCC 50983]|eukprot:XP_002776480.1 50S ribosomal protein L19, putative [Perkinsus marinus ATCC 50983]
MHANEALYMTGAEWYIGTRARPSEASQKVFTIDNPVTSKNWPPNVKQEPITPEYCKTLMEHLKLKEINEMKKKRTFTMPRMNLGDLVEVRYEISRSKKTFGTFQGYVIRTANKLLDSTFTLKNSYDGITVEQTISDTNGGTISAICTRKDTKFDGKLYLRNSVLLGP